MLWEIKFHKWYLSERIAVLEKDSVLTKNERKELTDLAPPRVFFTLWDCCGECKEYWWNRFLFKVPVFNLQWRAKNFYSRHSESRRYFFFWSNIWRRKNVFKIFKIIWKYELEKQAGYQLQETH